MNSDKRTHLIASLKQVPYASALGVELKFTDDGFILTLPYKPSNIGNPVIPALHGGAIGGFMEIAAVAEILLNYPDEGPPKTIGLNIDYLRTGKPQDCFAKAKIARHGRRIVNVSVHVWQNDPEKPIAALHGHFLIQKNKDL